MKKILGFFALAAVLFSCEKKTSEVGVSTEDSVVLPVEVTYKGVPVIGNMKNVQTVMEWNKRLSELNLDLGDLLADTVTFHLHEGVDITASRDSSIAVLKQFVNSMASVKINYTAVIPVDNATVNDEWVFSWTEETYNYKDGKTAHHFLHEDYRMVDGKIREVYQYARMEPTAQPAGK
jgi:hypothetical protein